MQDMHLFFPDKYPKGRTCNRTYFFTVLSTLHPDYTKKLIEKSKELRFAPYEENAKGETIEIDEGWEEELRAFP